MLITSPKNVRTFGWILESASPRTISRMILLPPQPMAAVQSWTTWPPLADEW